MNISNNIYPTFKTETMSTILHWIKQQLQIQNQTSFIVLNPDLNPNQFAGFYDEELESIHRSYRSWTDAALLLHCRMLTPVAVDNEFIKLTFVKLNETISFHNEIATTEKYGSSSIFAKINKHEEPSFLYFYEEALRNVSIQNRKKILNLGINDGDEFVVIKNLLGESAFLEKTLVGIDHSMSAITKARESFPQNNVHLIQDDINQLPFLKLGKFDLIITIGTLQSSSIDFKPFFMSLVQNHLESNGALILGFPNCRWIDGEMIYGAKAPNYRFTEMSIVIKDIYFCKKYLQQKKFRVTLTGKDYLFLTATKINHE